ncbi:hypothetical protein C1E23_20675 [Pseudoalteromonas phenolica]|uniref:Uncharacterized protein n=1 Tax=Pseudoalteromonas phenolica TaxID=161398 RepID=A0A4Q7IHD5_9GAMM|nr:hypothetical protein [Pseudoalteromonas phenolica]RZQ51220.1 hypothetical protein C1E23_20675 [Pseudoalteromonas phenolica]
MKFLDLMEVSSKTNSASSLLNMLHHFGNFISKIDDAQPDSEMYIDALINTKKPAELLQLGLDVIRCIYEPSPIGTWLLNGNPDFLEGAMKESTGSVAYHSSSVCYDDDFTEHYREVVVPSLNQQGIDNNHKGNTAFVIVSTGDDYLTSGLVNNINDMLIDYFNIDKENDDNTLHIGYCRDDALVDSIRVSVLVVS